MTLKNYVSPMFMVTGEHIPPLICFGYKKIRKEGNFLHVEIYSRNGTLHSSYSVGDMDKAELMRDADQDIKDTGYYPLMWVS